MESPSTETTECFSHLAWCLWGAGTPGPRMGHPLSRGAGPWGWGEDSWWNRAGEAAGCGTVCRGLEAAASSRAGPCRSRGGGGGWRVQHGLLQPRSCPLSTARGAQAAQHQRHRVAWPALPAAPRPGPSPPRPQPHPSLQHRPHSPSGNPAPPQHLWQPPLVTAFQKRPCRVPCCSPGRGDSSARDVCLDRS